VTAALPTWHRGGVSATPRPWARVPAATAAGVAVAALLTGCGGSATPAEVVVTVTASTKDAAGESPSTTPSTTSEKPAPAETLKSDDVGRKFDFGKVTSVKSENGTLVFAVDRWTVPSLDDAKLAQTGIEVAPYNLSNIPFRNVNKTNTFRVPVRDGASFLLHHCVAKGEPVTSKSVSAKELAAADPVDALVLLRIDPKTGYATGGETLAAC
jgi:hypothetical protein